MGVENAACPWCGRQTLVTVPMGQYLLQVSQWGWKGRPKGHYVQTASCQSCKKTFYVMTKEAGL